MFLLHHIYHSMGSGSGKRLRTEAMETSDGDEANKVVTVVLSVHDARIRSTRVLIY